MVSGPMIPLSSVIRFKLGSQFSVTPTVFHIPLVVFDRWHQLLEYFCLPTCNMLSFAPPTPKVIVPSIVVPEITVLQTQVQGLEGEFVTRESVRRIGKIWYRLRIPTPLLNTIPYRQFSCLKFLRSRTVNRNIGIRLMNWGFTVKELCRDNKLTMFEVSKLVS